MSSLHEKPGVSQESNRHSAETAKSEQASSSLPASDLPFRVFMAYFIKRNAPIVAGAVS
jgi:hypothetical protein